MKRTLIILLIVNLSGCQKKDDTRHLYFQVKTFQKDLYETIQAQDIYIQSKTENSNFFNEQYTRQSKIALRIRNIGYSNMIKNRQKIVGERDSINNVLHLNLNFAPCESYKNIDDSIFKIIINIDFLRMTKRYQDLYMFPPTEM